MDRIRLRESEGATFHADTPGVYYIHTALTITHPDSAGCSFTDTIVVTVPEIDTPLPFPSDTTLCEGQPIGMVLPNVIEYLWSLNSSAISTEATFHPVDSGTYHLRVIGECHDTASTTIHVTIDTTCVWPGDMNNDGMVNIYDLIAWHYKINATDAARDSTGIEWQGYSALPWPLNLFGWLNPQYIDADGNGTINTIDIDALYQNYGRVHGPDTPTLPHYPGSNLVATVVLVLSLIHI